VTKLRVSDETAPDTLARIPGLLREAVQKQQGTRFDRAHFIAFGDQSFDFELSYVVGTPDYRTFLDVQQSVNLDILRAFEAEGISMAHRVTAAPPPGT